MREGGWDALSVSFNLSKIDLGQFQSINSVKGKREGKRICCSKDSESQCFDSSAQLFL